MKTKIEIKSVFGSVLFEHESENNSIKKTLEEAVKSKAYLCNADLRNADLVGADLRNAYLVGADLRNADIRNADLCNADLRDANLRNTNLVCADLRNADIRNADIRNAYLCGAYIVGAHLRYADLRDANLGEEWGKIESPQDVLCVGCIGSRDAYTTIFHTDKGIFVQCGCFRGTLDEFAQKVKETHKGTKYERDYNALIEFAKIKFS